MASSSGPRIARTGLSNFWDAGSDESYRGPATTNLAYGIISSISNQNNTYFKVQNGTESAFIPYFNDNINVKYVDFYNDYAGGSGNCCPNLYSYHTTAVAVSGSTAYMYQIIFKTDNGYYHPNYMYRYEYGASGYISEGGLVNASRLESLGDGWYHAWAEFTTNAATTIMNLYLFHYEYATWNRVRVAAVSLTQGTTVLRPEHFINLDYRTTRGTTVSTGGGLIDLVGSIHGELYNGVSFTSGNGGSLYFDGTDDFVNIPTSLNLGNSLTLIALVKMAGTGDYVVFGSDSNGNDNWFGVNNSQVYLFVTQASDVNNVTLAGGTLTVGQWHHIAATVNINTIRIYLDGVLVGSQTMNFTIGNWDEDGAIGRRGQIGQRYFYGNIAFLQMFKSALSETEIRNHYNTYKGRTFRSTNRNTILTRRTVRSLANALYTSVSLFLDPGNEQSYNTTSRFWNDLSINARRLTLYPNGGTTYRLAIPAALSYSTDGKGSIVFDGSNDFGRFDTEITTTTDYTFSAWVKTTATGERGIYSHCSGGPVALGYSLYDGRMKYWYYFGQWYTPTSSTAINDGTWKNLVWVKKGTNMKMFINGYLDYEVTLVGSVTGLMRSFGTLWGPCSSDNYGVGSDDYSQVFSGSIGVSIAWDRALGDSEVLQLFDDYKSRYITANSIVPNGLLLYLDATNTSSYPGTGTTWADLSGNGRNFTIDAAFTFNSTGKFFQLSDAGGISRAGSITSSTTCTVVLWIRTIDTQALFLHGQDGSYYLGAYYSTSKEYHSNVGSPAFYEDTVEQSNIFDFALDGNWHMLEFKSVNLQNWTTYQFNRYGSFTFDNGALGAIMIYNRNLSQAESLFNYNTMKSRFANSTVSTNGLVLLIDSADYSSYTQSGTVVKDTSGKGFTASLVNGVTWAPNTHGGYFVLDGANDYILANTTSLNSQLTTKNASHFIWVYPYGAGNIIMETDTPSSLLFNWHASIMEINSSGAISFSLWHGSLTTRITSSNLSFNRWYYVGLTYEGTTLSAFINGIRIGTATLTRQVPSDYNYATHYAIGAQDNSNMGTSAYLNGAIGSYKIYNRALSRLEILQNYKAQRGRFGLQTITDNLAISLDSSDLSSYQGSGTTWLDISGNRNNGTLQNGPTYDSANGGSLLFDGTNDNLYLNYSRPSTCTIDFWVKWVSSPGGIYSRIISTSPSDNFELGVNSSRQLSYYPNGSGVWQEAVATLTTAWNHVAITITGSSITIFLNGSSAYSGSTTATSGTALYVGSRYSSNEASNVYIGAFRVYTKVLSATEVSRNYNADRQRFGL